MRRVLAEFLGTALLLATVVGSGVMGDSLSPSSEAIALLANAIATGAILYVLITILGPVSGAHFNPVVTAAFLMRGELPLLTGLLFVSAQIAGGIGGVGLAHAMFELDVMQAGVKARTGPSQWLSEGVATFGLVITILGCVRYKAEAVAAAVGLYITSAYWFTASTSFANPAVTVARAFTETFSGIQLVHAPAFIASQFAGAVIAVILARWLFQKETAPQ